MIFSTFHQPPETPSLIPTVPAVVAPSKISSTVPNGRV